MTRRCCGAVLLVLCALSCSRQNYLKVTVENLPASTRSILVLAASGSERSLALAPIDRAGASDSPAHFVLALPAAFSGPLDLAVGAYQEAGAQGCLLAAGTSSLSEFMRPRQETFVTVAGVRDVRCVGKSPVLFDATPRTAKTEGGELIELIGFGFQPGVIVKIGGAPAVVEQRTYERLSVRVPAYAGFGPVDVQVMNSDQSQDTRRDLLNLYNPTVTLGAQILSRTNCFLSDAGGMVSAQFYPNYADGLAVSKYSKNEVDVWGFDGVTDRRRDFNTGSNPTTIAAADFDNDGDQDIVVANSTGSAFEILTNDVDTMSMERIFNRSVPSPSLSANPLVLAIGDIDRDGSVDVIVGIDSMPPSLIVWKNDGFGHFSQEGIPLALQGKPVSLAIGRIDNDDYPDIAVSAINDPRGKGTRILFNQASAAMRFIDKGSKGILLVTDEDVNKIMIGDVNGDGLNDVVSASATSAKIFTIINKIPNGYEKQTLSANGNLVNDIALRDMNGDGLSDLISASINAATNTGMIEIFLARPGAGLDSKAESSIIPTICERPSRITTLSSRRNGRNDIVFIGIDKTDGTPCGGMPEGCIGAILNQSM